MPDSWMPDSMADPSVIYPLMGLLALGVLWLNTLLIAAAALKQRAELAKERDELLAAQRSGALARFEVVSGEGPDGAILTRTIHQMGRAMTVSGPDRILFTESRIEVVVHGGKLAPQAGDPRPLEGTVSRVWMAHETPLERSLADFDDAFKRASTSKGLTTFGAQPIRKGQAVWFQPGVLVSTVDPVAAVRRRMHGLLAFAVLSVAVCAAITTLVFVPPIFGTVSTVGGALGLLFFVLVQPAGVKARNWARLPDQQPTSSTWQRPGT